MKKVLTVIISAIAFGLIAGLCFVGINVFAVKTGIINNNAIVNEIESLAPNEGETKTITETETQVTEKPHTSNYSYYDSIPDLITDVMPTVVSITHLQKFRQDGY